MEVNVSTRSKSGSSRTTRLHFNQPATKVTLKDLQARIATELKISTSRQRLTTLDKKTVIEAEADKITLADHGLGQPKEDLLLKDLGPQMSWRLVYLIEYFGPLFIHPIVYHISPKHYSKPYEHSNLQKIALACILFHFLKRELETLFVHRFSRATMPFFNLFKNCAHYWGLSGVALAVPLYGPWHSAQSIGQHGLQNQPWFLGSCLAVFMFGELANLYTHIYLAGLRPAGTKKRQLPNGFGFKTCTSANYSFELLAWTAFCIMTMELAAVGFSIVAFMQIVPWAAKRREAYVKEFGKDQVKGRKALIPFVL